MSQSPPTLDELRRENDELRQRLDEAEQTIRAIRGGEVDAFVVQSEEAEHVRMLGTADRPYRLLVEKMQQGAVTLTSDGTIAFANPRFLEMLALPGDAVGGELLDCVEPADRPTAAALIDRARGDGAEGRLAMRRPNGTTFPAHLTASPLIEEAGIVCLIVTDLTEQQRQEQGRLRLLREEAARVEAEKLAETLRQADRKKDEFLAVLAHELRNPLAPLRTGLTLLNRSGADPAAVETREMMGRQLENLVRLVDDLLDIGRLTQGKIRLRKEGGDLVTAVSRAVESSRAFIEERGHRLEVSLPGVPLPVDADTVRIAQVLTNLLHNAAKFTPRGGVVRLAIERDGSWAVVRVRDNGAGIAPAVLPRIFDLFTQADPTLTRAEGGLGIGLTLARHLTELHGGSLEAASEGPGKGSEFTVRLPLGEADAAALRPSARVEGSPPRAILLVDDNVDSARSLAALLRLQGHDVRVAHGGPQALAAAAERPPEVVILDIGLPGMSGYDIARELRAREPSRNLVLLALTGYGSAEDRRQSREAGFNGHLVKPVDLAALQGVLKEMPRGNETGA